jgi:hypothetical protein
MPVTLIRYLWPAPVSAVGVLLALGARVSGGRLAVREGVLEAWGGWLRPGLVRIYPPMAIAAITLGHVVLARGEMELAVTRSHERVHVRQYERWGVLFPLLYLCASLAARLAGGDAYRDNRFEREAFRAS